MIARTRLPCRLADITLVGVVVNLIVLVAAPILRPDLNLLKYSLSYYAVGPWGALQAIAFVAMGIASAALGFALLRAHVTVPGLLVVALLLVISGIAGLGLVWYPMGAPGPETILGDAHQTAGTVGGVAQLAAALIFTAAIRDDIAWRGLFPIAITAFLIALAGALLTQIAIWWPHLGIPMGATMRLLVVPLVGLWGLIAFRLRRACE